GPPGTAVLLITGSVITAGDARLLLTRATPGEPAPGPAGTAHDDLSDDLGDDLSDDLGDEA
ncbi:MAG: hypothetical protein WA895_17615, partial [Streptosporangiaceae bacterium]